jgi:chloramphenicol 3-O phosphotransferase
MTSTDRGCQLSVGRFGHVSETQRGQVILLNGTSSAGKTTLARAIQEISPVPYLYTGIDSQFAMVPEKWGGGRGGPLSVEGFRYNGSEEDDDPAVTMIAGPVGLSMLRAMHRATAVLCAEGFNVVIDEMLLARELLTSWRNALRGMAVLFVAVECPLPVLEERERRRRQPHGLARGQLDVVHAHGWPYDMRIDTSTAEADELAADLLTRLEHGPPPTAFSTTGTNRSVTA